MWTLLILAAAGAFFVRALHRLRQEETRSSPGDPRRDASDWKARVPARWRRVGLRLGVAAIPGCVAVVAGGLLLGLWGLAAGTVVLAAGMVWAASSRGGMGRLRRSRSGSLTESERRQFDEIAARLSADD